MSLPTRAELPILKALWALGTATSPQVYAHITEQGLYYTSNTPTVILRRLVEKSLVAREPAPHGTRGHVYAARVGRDEVVAMITEGL